MPKYKYMEEVLSFIARNKCVTRHMVKVFIMNTFNLNDKKAEMATQSSMNSLLKKNLIKRIGIGVYCINVEDIQ